MKHRVQQLSSYSGVAMTVVAAALVLYALSAHAGRSVSAPIAGAYKVQVAGYGRGEGSCDVGAKEVSVDCTIQGDDGNTQKLKANKLKLDGNRFSGDAALDGVKCRIAGRIDQSRVAGGVPRLMATFLADDGRAGRILGNHQ